MKQKVPGLRPVGKNGYLIHEEGKGSRTAGLGSTFNMMYPRYAEP